MSRPHPASTPRTGSPDAHRLAASLLAAVLAGSAAAPAGAPLAASPIAARDAGTAAPPSGAMPATLSAGLSRAAAADPAGRVVAWVHFTDRAGAEHDPAALGAARRALAERTLERRARRGAIRDVSASDLPVHPAYVEALIARGARLRGTSRWLNAASVEMPAGLAPGIARLPFVRRVAAVPRATRLRPVPETGAIESAGALADAPDGRRSAPLGALGSGAAPGDTAWYGGAFRQLDMMQVPALHAAGLSGAGVLVCVLDSGFRTTHEVFAGLDVVATRDFVHGDLVVDDEPGQDEPGAGSHGTQTLACVAGRLPGVYAGGAFAASVALGKTEDVASETPVEMDYWQFGAEWADSLGADVISSSLGYSWFDDPLQSYTYDDMDGRTTGVTLAALEAARRGITVVTAAGNEGATPWRFVVAPGDADSIVTVGAVDSFNVVTSFSSRGPTADGRIKPDVTAMGRRVLCPSFTDDAAYQRVSGTSFSTPLTAGVVALLLEAHPAWGPIEVRDALRATALNQATPDPDIGWGLVQGLAARDGSPGGPVAAPGPAPRAGLALAAGPNPLVPGATMTVRFNVPGGAARATLEALDLGGRRRVTLHDGPPEGPGAVSWDGTGRDGTRLPPGAYWLRLVVHAAGEPPRSVARRVVVLE